MATIPMIITAAGLAECINAEQNGTAPVVLTKVGLGSGQYTATATQTALHETFKEITTIAGGATADNQIHISVYDDSADSYVVHEVGVYTASGTLFAVSSQLKPMIEKASSSLMMFAIDVTLSNLNPDTITVGDTNFQLNYATTEMAGVVELATDGETINGTDSLRAVTPAALHAKTATAGRRGLVQLATDAETIAGTNATKAITPAAMLAAFVREHGETGYQKFPGGLIVQWGKAQIAPDGKTAIKLPVTFPNEALDALPISTDDVQVSYSLHSLTKGAVSFKHNGNGGVFVKWLAVGR